MKTSLIIPTLNRYHDMEKALNNFLLLRNFPLETLIVDQSDDDKTKLLCEENTYEKLHIRYFHCKTKSGAVARNIGIENINKESDIVVFLDDDVTVQPDFLDQIILFFKSHPKAKGGVANIESPLRSISLMKKIGLFLLTGGLKFTETFVTRGGFNVMPLTQPTTLKNVEWTSGCGMFFRKDIFDEGFRFEPRFMRYSLMEDCFFSYAVNQKYPKSLYFVPEVHMTHHETPAARVANKVRIYQNIVHRYLFVRTFKKSTAAYLRTMLIFCIFDIMNFRTLKVVGRYSKGIKYVLSNKNNILQPDFDFNTFIFG